MEKKMIVTIARQYGSGGREIGERLAELLGVPLYDRELISETAEEGNLHPEVAARVDEKAANSLLYTIVTGGGMNGIPHEGEPHLPANDRLFFLQCRYVRERAAEGGGVFIGRCADYILQDDPDRFSVFLYAPTEARLARVLERHPELKRSEALSRISKTDKERANYYSFYTGKKWGKYDNYHMALDSHALGIEGTARLLAAAARLRAEGSDA